MRTWLSLAGARIERVYVEGDDYGDDVVLCLGDGRRIVFEPPRDAYEYSPVQWRRRAAREQGYRERQRLYRLQGMVRQREELKAVARGDYRCPPSPPVELPGWAL